MSVHHPEYCESKSMALCKVCGELEVITHSGFSVTSLFECEHKRTCSFHFSHFSHSSHLEITCYVSNRTRRAGSALKINGLCNGSEAHLNSPEVLVFPWGFTFQHPSLVYCFCPTHFQLLFSTDRENQSQSTGNHNTNRANNSSLDYTTPSVLGGHKQTHLILWPLSAPLSDSWDSTKRSITNTYWWGSLVGYSCSVIGHHWSSTIEIDPVHPTNLLDQIRAGLSLF